jgi:hypothetical protein
MIAAATNKNTQPRTTTNTYQGATHMPSYKRDYNPLTNNPNPHAKHDAAIEDCYAWHEGVTLTLLDAAIQGCPWRQFSFSARFGGIQGYPVVALHNEGQELRRQTS